MKIFENPNYLILEDKEYYIFYNSIRHYACRISELDLSLFNLIYIHKDLDKIIKEIHPKYHEYVRSVHNTVSESMVLSEEPILIYKDIIKTPPQSYYLHLTYRCNLACTYCYNKNIRHNFSDLSLEKWKFILDKILPFSKNIVLTGGEPTLTTLLPHVIRYIKQFDETIYIEIISNCMTDFENYSYREEVFNNIDSVVFSCDNLTDIGQQRINFKPNLFKQNMSPLRKPQNTISEVCNSLKINGRFGEISAKRTFRRGLKYKIFKRKI